MKKYSTRNKMSEEYVTKRRGESESYSESLKARKRNSGLPKSTRSTKQPMAPTRSQRMPSQENIDKNSTKGTMGEGKVDTVGAIVRGVKKAATKMGDSVKRMVETSTNRTTQVREDNKDRVNQLRKNK